MKKNIRQQQKTSKSINNPQQEIGFSLTKGVFWKSFFSFCQNYSYEILLIFLVWFSTFFDMTTAINNPVFVHSEANPLFILFGGFTVAFALNFLLNMFLTYKLLKSISIRMIYIVVTFMIMLTSAHLYGSYTNLVVSKQFSDSVIKEKVQLQQMYGDSLSDNEINYYAQQNIVNDYKKISLWDKLSYYFGTIFLFVIIPLSLGFISFFISIHVFEKRNDKRTTVIKQIKKLTEQYLE